ncbi:hypothetical protein RZS08_00975, partial [Arthrospira platensis SPKY1]|nr:hypothetical protein [Arthrospira platensis SPKY1]
AGPGFVQEGQHPVVAKMGAVVQVGDADVQPGLEGPDFRQFQVDAGHTLCFRRQDRPPAGLPAERRTFTEGQNAPP